MVCKDKETRNKYQRIYRQQKKMFQQAIQTQQQQQPASVLVLTLQEGPNEAMKGKFNSIHIFYALF
jgi:altronate dehydratase